MRDYILAVIGGLVVGVSIAVGFVYCTPSYGARLHPTVHEIVVREVENGFVVEAHVRNNPFPYKAFVFQRADMVGSAVSGLLGERIPGPRWGK